MVERFGYGEIMQQVQLAVFNGAKMKERRLKRKIGRRQLAKIVGVTVEAIRQFESGISTPLLGNMRKIEDALRLRPGALIQR